MPATSILPNEADEIDEPLTCPPNSVFKDCWKELGSEFVNRCPVLNEVDWDLDKLKNYFDGSDYVDSQLVHFFQFFPPWDKNNIRFNPIWEYHKKCEEI